MRRNRITLMRGGVLAGLFFLAMAPFLAGYAGAQPPPFQNELGMTFVWIPPGDFMMGAAGQETGRGGDEPRHQVTITRPFYIQNREVNQGQWEQVMGSNPSRFRSCGKECPVEQVSWHDVQEFIRRLNAREGKDMYRLPTEAEWEYAARGPDRNDPGASFLYLAGGDRPPLLDGVAWYRGNSCAVGADARGINDSARYFDGEEYALECGPQPGGRKRPNSWGLYDMLGNVWEWVQDWHAPYPTGSVVDPIGPPEGELRVYRGGGWLSSPGYCLPAVRGGAEPGIRDIAVGFRLVRTVPPATLR